MGVAEYKGIKLVKIRNPWGSERYKGEWSDNDTKNWTADALKALGHTKNKRDGIFFMTIANYQKLFYNTITGFYQDWKITTKDEKWDRKSSIKNYTWTIENPAAQAVHIGIAGAMSRNFSPRWGCKSGANMESFYFTIDQK